MTLIFTFVLLVTFFYLAFATAKTYRIRSHKEGITVGGTVIYIEKTYAVFTGTYYNPIVSFVTKEGEEMTVKTSVSKGYSIGQKVEVVYLPGLPEKAEIKSSDAFSFRNDFLEALKIAVRAFLFLALLIVLFSYIDSISVLTVVLIILAFFIFSLISTLRRKSYIAQLNDQGITADGTIIYLELTFKGVLSGFNPIVRFTTRDGKEMIVKTSASEGYYFVGQKVEVVYLSDSPEKAEINDLSALVSNSEYLRKVAWDSTFAVLFVASLILFYFDADLATSLEKYVFRNDAIFIAILAVLVFARGVIAPVNLILLLRHKSYIRQLNNKGIIVNGTIINIIGRTTGNLSHCFYYYPVVRFTTRDGKEMTVKTSASKGYSVGQKVEIIYLSDAPKKAEIKDSDAFSSRNEFSREIYAIGVEATIVLFLLVALVGMGFSATFGIIAAITIILWFGLQRVWANPKL